jgi:hypothetical protein
MQSKPMTADDYRDALDVLELARKALYAHEQPERRLVQAYLDLRATVEAMKPGENEA